MGHKYNKDNIFAKILRGELFCDKIIESDYSLAFKDVNPRAKVHVLVVPKKAYMTFTDFVLKSSNEEKTDIFNTILKVVEKEKIKESGYRLITNCGKDGHQEVQHLHFHVLGGQPLGGFIKKLNII
tara:strand:- start:17039 stop:17416 length:378 start_codon:yes stop_codon:yes gene_type:complete